MLRLLPKSGIITVEIQRQKTQSEQYGESPLLKEAEEARDRLYRLQYVTTALSQAVTPSQIADIIVSLGLATLKASGSTVWLFDGSKQLYLAASKGYTKEQVDNALESSKKGTTPMLDAIRLKKPIYLRSLNDRKKLYPNTVKAYRDTHKQSFIAIPLLIDENVLGVVAFAFDIVHEFTIEEKEFIFALVKQCSQSLDRARLYDEEVQQKEQLQATIDKVDSLQKVTAQLVKALTPSEMGNILLEESMKILKANAGEVSILSKDKRKIRIVSYKGYPKSFASPYLEWKETDFRQPMLTYDVIKTGKPLFIDDISDVPEKYKTARNFTKTLGFSSHATIPLKIGNEFWGILSLYFKSSPHLSEEELSFLDTLSFQFAQAYGRAQLYEEEKTQKQRLEISVGRLTVLHEVTRLLTSAMTLEKVTQIILNHGTKALGADGGEISLLSEDSKKFKVIAYAGYPKEFTKDFVKQWQELPSSEPLLMWDVVREHRTVFLTDIADVPPRYKLSKRFAEITHAKSSAIIPLTVKGRVLGVFYLLFNKRNIFLDEDKQFILTLAQHLSQAVERAQVYDKEKAAAEHLRQSEENWKQLAESIPSLVWVTDWDGHTIYWNKRWEEYTGIPQNEITTEAFWKQVVHPEDTNVGELHWKNSVNKKIPMEFEYRARSKTGEYRWFLSRAVPVKNKDGEVVRWLGTDTDIHDQKMTSKEIEKREARFRALIENSSEAVVLIDKEGKILYASPSTRKVTGYSADERLGKVVYASIYPKDKEKVKAFIHKLSELPEDDLLTIQYRRINKDGSIPWMEGVGKNLLNNPNVGALVVNYHDITERIESEQAIQQAKEELEIILENVADAIVVRGADGHIIYCNQAAVTISKYNSVEEYIEDLSYQTYLSRFETFFDENGSQINPDSLPVARVIREKKPAEQTIRVSFRDDHTTQWRKVTAAPILDNQGNIILIITVVRDITLEKEREKTKDEFISTASHELKTPITSAKLYAGILSEKIRNFGDEKTYTMITKLDSQLDRLTKLINDLLDVTKMKSGKITFTKVRVKVENFIEEIAEEMQYTTITHKINVVGESRKIISLDKERIRQVMINLLTNAIKYSPDDDKVDIILKDVRDGTIICVRDYGVGIEKGDQQRIFEPFYRALSQNEKFPGLGLGLHITHEIVKRHGGKMWVESTVGHGTKMFVFLPSKANHNE